jgi:uncharacterized protein YfkK (UPF0435 family)
LSGIAGIMTALIVASILPSLLVQFVYTDQAALMTGTPPFWLQNGSMIVFGLSVLYILYVAVATSMRSRKIAMLKQQLAMIQTNETFSPSELAAQEKELAQLEKMVDEALADGKKTTKPKTKARGRSAKK